MSEIRIQKSMAIGKSNPIPAKKQAEEAKAETQAQAPQVNPKSADEILDFLSNSAVVSPTSDKAKSKKIEVSKFVSPQQASGIAESVTKFFEGMEKHVEAAMKEFNLTEEQAQNLTALKFNQQFNDEDFAIIASGEKFIV